MDFWSALPIPLFLLAAAVALMLLHVRTWRDRQEREMEAAEHDYHRRQFRRRMQSSAMLGILALGILVGQLISGVVSPTIEFIFWGTVGLLALWVAALAVADMVATKHYYGRLRQDFVVQQAKLQAQARRMQTAQGNGKEDRGDRKSRKPKS